MTASGLARRLVGRYLAALAEWAFTRVDLALAGSLVVAGLALCLLCLNRRSDP